MRVKRKKKMLRGRRNKWMERSKIYQETEFTLHGLVREEGEKIMAVQVKKLGARLFKKPKLLLDR